MFVASNWPEAGSGPGAGTTPGRCGLGVGSGVAAVEVGTVEEQHRDSDDCKLDGEQ